MARWTRVLGRTGRIEGGGRHALLVLVMVSVATPLLPRAASASAGDISTVAGNGTAGYSGDGGPATSATLQHPTGVAVDRTGNVYIADQYNHRVRKVSTSGVISTVAGNTTAGYSGDGGPATNASLQYPHSVAVDSLGNLYIADQYNHRVRKVDASGNISTVAGNGSAAYSGDGGPAMSASLNFPSGVIVDSVGNLYIADTNNHRVRKVSLLGTISTVAGNGIAGYSGDGGPAMSASLNGPGDVAVDALDVYISDYYNHRVRKVSASGTISTVAGSGTCGYSGDGGPATGADLCYPTGVALDPSGLYITDYANHRVRKVSASGTISTAAGIGTCGYSGDGGPAASAALCYPTDVALDSFSNLYIADRDNQRVRKVEAGAGPVWSSDDCDATGANVVTGFIDGTYVKSRTTSGGPNTTWVCVAGEAASAHVGGKVSLNTGTPGLTVGGIDLDSGSIDACRSKTGTVHEGGFIAGEPWWIDVTPSPAGSTDSAWVCVRMTNAAGFRLRFAPGVSVGLPSFSVDSTAAHVPAYVDAPPAAPGQPSSACQLASGTRLANITVGSTPVQLYSWPESASKAHLCVRGGATGGAGAQFTVDTGGVSTGITTTNSTAPCPFPLFVLDVPSLGAYTSNPSASLPASACVAMGSTALGVTANAPTTGPVVTVQQDTA